MKISNLTSLIYRYAFCLMAWLAAPAALGGIGPVPANVVRLADFGGVPSASSSSIISAFNQAFNKLKSLGGGTLKVDPGLYNLGNIPNESYLIQVSDLSNVVISAYGAQLSMTTTAAKGMPVMLGFTNPNNVTVAGMSFIDYGTDLNINWKGAICISVDTNKPVSGFKTVDIVADRVGTMFRSSYPTVNYTGSEYDIQGTVSNSYYGVSASYNGRFSKTNIKAHNVRRAFISYGAKDWDVTVNGSSDGVSLGSNAYVEVVPSAVAPVENVNINLSVSGNMKTYYGLVHIYNQSPLSSYSYTRNVQANVTLNNLSGFPSRVFVFDHEYPVGVINSTSPRTYENVILNGQVNGTFSGTMIASPTVSTGSPNSISVSRSLAAYQNMSALPSYFKVVDMAAPAPAPAPVPVVPVPTPAPAPAISLSVQGAPNLPLNGTSTLVTVGFVSGTPTKVEISRDGYAPFAAYPAGSFFTLSADGKSLSGNWCITSVCWGGISGAHILNVVATYANGLTAKASVSLNVADPIPALSVSGVQMTNDASNVYFKYNFSGSVKFHRLFLNTDRNDSTGYLVNGVGADYLIENGILYRYSGTKGSWGWTAIKSVKVSATLSSATLTVARADLRNPSQIELIILLSDVSKTATSSILVKNMN